MLTIHLHTLFFRFCTHRNLSMPTSFADISYLHGSAMCVRTLFETGKLCTQSKRDDSSTECSPLQTLSKISGVLVAFWTITGT